MEQLFVTGAYRGEGRWIDQKTEGRYAVFVRIHGPQGDVTGPGYVLDRECHYDIDVTPDNHLEFTFHAEGASIIGLGSATNKGNRTYWKESLDRL